MARFDIESWLATYGFARVSGASANWWAFKGLAYFLMDVKHEEQSLVVYDYDDNPPPRTAVGEAKEEVWDPEEDPARWTEYRFPWPTTLAQAQAIAEAMGWIEHPAEPRDTPLPEFLAGIDTLLNEFQ